MLVSANSLWPLILVYELKYLLMRCLMVWLGVRTEHMTAL